MKTRFYVHFVDIDGQQRTLGRCFSLQQGLERLDSLPFYDRMIARCWVAEYRDGRLVARHQREG